MEVKALQNSLQMIVQRAVIVPRHRHRNHNHQRLFVACCMMTTMTKYEARLYVRYTLFGWF